MSVTSDSPKFGNRFNVLGICRISTEHQRDESLEDQEQLYRRKLDELYGADRYDLRIIASRGSGERLDSAALLETMELLNSGNFDLAVCEDLGRFCRRAQAISIVEAALDARTRVIAFNDHLDTDKEGWRLSAWFAVMRHEQYNADTSARIRRTQLNQFNQGRQLPCAIYGYLKPREARHETEMTKDPAAEPIYERIFSMLESGHSFADVADKLNELKVPLGPICKRSRWDSTIVGRIVRNPILKGLREHNRRVTYRIHSSGRHVTRKAKSTETVRRYVPHLAFIEPERYDRVIAIVSERNKRFSRNKNGHDPLLNRPKKSTKWPGQHCYCGVCGRVFIYGKSGGLPFLKCSGLTEHHCWNGFYIQPQLMRDKVTAAIFKEIAQLSDFDRCLRENLTAETEALLKTSSQQSVQLADRIREYDRQLGNLATSIARLGGNETLEAQLGQLQLEKQQAQAERRNLESQKPVVPQLPAIEQLRKQALAAVQGLSVESKEFSLLVRKMISRLIVYPTSLIGGRPTYGYRVKFRLKLWHLCDKNLGLIPSIAEHLTKVVELDLDDGPQHVRYLAEIVKLRTSGLTEQKVMTQLQLTRPVIQRAMSLHRDMERLGVSDPWEELNTLEGRECRVRAHLHPRYIFKPIVSTDDWI